MKFIEKINIKIIVSRIAETVNLNKTLYRVIYVVHTCILDNILFHLQDIVYALH